MAEDLDQAAQSYLNVAGSFIHGLIRLLGAEAAFSRSVCALTEFNISGRSGLDGPASRVLSHLARIDSESCDSLVYVTNVSHLVYATTLLDTFLSDTTLFLFLLNPRSIGKNQQVPLRNIIEAASRGEVITKAAAMRAREISYLPFVGRIQFLRDSFGLVISIDGEAEVALTHYSSIRNAAVHDQGVFELWVDDQGLVCTKQKTCVLHPTRVDGADVGKAIDAYRSVVRSIALAIFSQVLNVPDHPKIQRLLEVTFRVDSQVRRSGEEDV